MNKTEFIENIASKVNVTKSEAAEFLDAFIATIHENLHEGIRITGLGTFAAQQRSARIARNPQTGAEIKVPAKWVPAFKAGTALKDAAAQKEVH